ncbi:MAG: hypothetical protein R3321_03055, partial [Nitrososphaeraceae archaeon]|nr:hypothetical protein [Nitrososphaeraceae archaeon]
MNTFSKTDEALYRIYLSKSDKYQYKLLRILSLTKKTTKEMEKFYQSLLEKNAKYKIKAREIANQVHFSRPFVNKVKETSNLTLD